MALTNLRYTVKRVLNWTFTVAAASRTQNRVNDEVESSNATRSKTYTYGSTGDLKANNSFIDKRTLNGTEHLNVSAGAHASAIALKNSNGDTITFTRLHEICITNNSAVEIQVGGDATDNITSLFGDNTDKIKIPAGGEWSMSAPLSAGFTVATNEVLTIITPSSAEYEVRLLGCS